MEELADCLVGTAGAGLGVEQRKRLTIGVELAARPELLLFLDEPTSGLDSQSAFNTVRLLRKLAAAGQAVLCTIHQLNAALFDMFDRLLLLGRGGRTVYFGDVGPDAAALRAYLRRHGAEAAPTDNVAEFMLEAIGAGAAPRVGDRDWADVWDESPERRAALEAIARIKAERAAAAAAAVPSAPGPGGAEAEREYTSPLARQLDVVCRRMFRAYWRSPGYVSTRLFNHVAVALVSGLTYLGLDDSRASLQHTVFLMFQVTVLPALIVYQVEVMFHVKRALSVREAAAEAPCSLLCVAAFFACLYFVPGLPAAPSRAGYQFLMVLATELVSVTLGQGLAALTPSARVSAQLDPFIIILFALFCGVAMPAPQMPAFWRAWLYPLNPFSRLISGMVTTALHGLPVRCRPDELSVFAAPPGSTCGQYMEPFFARGGPGYLVGDEFYEPLAMSFATRWRDLAIYAAFIGSNLAVLFAAVRARAAL